MAQADEHFYTARHGRPAVAPAISQRDREIEQLKTKVRDLEEKIYCDTDLTIADLVEAIRVLGTTDAYRVQEIEPGEPYVRIRRNSQEISVVADGPNQRIPSHSAAGYCVPLRPRPEQDTSSAHRVNGR